MADAGWIKLWRKLLDSPALQNDAQTGLWVRLLLHAAHKPTRMNWRGQTVALERGQLAISVRSFAANGGSTHKAVRVALDRFSREGMIHQQPILGTAKGTGQGTTGTLITICNFELYQLLEDAKGTEQGTGQGTIGAQQGHTIQEGKESKNKIQSPTGDSSPQAVTKAQTAREMIAIYHRVCGDLLPRVVKLTATRQQHLLARLADLKGNLAQWELVCKRVRASGFLTGQRPASNGHPPFIADIDFITTLSKFVRISEGFYDDRKPTTPLSTEQWAARLAAEHAERHGYH